MNTGAKKQVSSGNKPKVVRFSPDTKGMRQNAHDVEIPAREAANGGLVLDDTGLSTPPRSKKGLKVAANQQASVTCGTLNCAILIFY